MRRMSETHPMRIRIIPDLVTFAPLFMPMRIFCFLDFWPYISSKNFINYTIRLNLTRAIDWCINFHACLEKNSTFFLVKLKLFKHIFTNFTKKKVEIFSNQTWKFLHQWIAIMYRCVIYEIHKNIFILRS
jgi:hypothetical protein